MRHETPEAALQSVHKPLPHDSAQRHVCGAALYIDDIPEPEGTLHLALGLSPQARGRLVRLDLAPVLAWPGVVAVASAADVPGANDIAPTLKDEPCFATDRVLFHGQPLFAVAATTRLAARKAALAAHVEIEAETPDVDVLDGRASGRTVLPPYEFSRGEASRVIAAAPHRLAGSMRIGGQEHFYLEGQIALAVPGEDDEIVVHSSTQHPSEVQHIVARVLGIPDGAVTVECRRMGGGFGGKETQATQWAAIAAVMAVKTGKPCKLRLDRDDDFVLTGKRHDMLAEWSVGFEPDGAFRAVEMDFAARCGCSADLSGGVVDRTMFHADNSYFLPSVRVATERVKTDTVSNTAFRGFGGPQGMVGVERVMDAVAQTLRLDPLDVRKRNLYAAGRDVTPYGMTVEDWDTLLPLIETLESTSRYRARRADIASWNAASPYLKRGLALTPVKFGISFTLGHLNQAGALVHVYQDGSVQLNHGGTEMGQGLFVKVAQVVADEFGIPLGRVKIMATSTAKVPNTAPTAASAGSDLNGMAARNAARAIKARMAEAALAKLGGSDEVTFQDGEVRCGDRRMTFRELAQHCVLSRVSLSSTGFYATPKITWNRAEKTGRPFFYFAYGAACSEVAIDTLTGEMKVLAVDILHDCGRSLNPAIDRGQIEGGFVQGMGWLTTEELVYDRHGRLRTHAPATYKIPVSSDVPEHFEVALWDGGNREDTIYRSKAVGEPPVMLAISVLSAIGDAVHSLRPGRAVRLDAPATPEAIMRAVVLQREAA